jgi:hypothetical protein
MFAHFGPCPAPCASFQINLRPRTKLLALKGWNTILTHTFVGNLPIEARIPGSNIVVDSSLLRAVSFSSTYIIQQEKLTEQQQVKTKCKSSWSCDPLPLHLNQWRSFLLICNVNDENLKWFRAILATNKPNKEKAIKWRDDMMNVIYFTPNSKKTIAINWQRTYPFPHTLHEVVSWPRI